MNQNTTIETIREAIEEIGVIRDALPYGSGDGRSALVSVAVRLGDLANCLEAAPQPPVEQSEPAAEHPLHAGIDWSRVVPGEFCYLEMDYSICPCGGVYPHGVGSCGFEKLATVEIEIRDGKKVPIGLWLAPTVIEPEPELDEFEQWAERCSTDPNETAKEWQNGVGYALNQYRAIKRRKGDK